jgi:hypothetical protein
MDFFEVSKNLPRKWEALAVTLLEYARHISRSQPVWENEQWVFRPENFVTFRIQHKRKHGLTLYLRGTEDEFPNLPNKTVVNSVPGYSKIIVDRFEQAPEALLAICRAYDLFCRGRTRQKRKMAISEA